MKHFFFILLFGLVTLSGMNAQQVKEVTAIANNDTIIINCTLETSVFCNLQLQYSNNNGVSWSECKTILGDIKNQESGKKTIYWSCLKDGIIMGDFIFKVIVHPLSKSIIDESEVAHRSDLPQIQNPEKIKKQKGHFVILPGYSLGNTTSYSLMLGYVKKYGSYVKIKSSFSSKEKASKGDVDDAFYNGNTNKGRFSIYVGAIRQLHPYIFLYAGIGYGNKWLQWETVSNTIIEIQSSTYSGIDPEIGVLFKIKMFTLGGGFNCLVGKGHKNGEGNISIGVIF